MDTIKFIIEDYVDEVNGFRFPTINIYINDINLIELVQRIERGYRDPLEADEQLPQSYVGLYPAFHHDFAEEFLGRKGYAYSVLLTCTCLEEACNSIIAKVLVDSETVTWSEIRSPFLGTQSSFWVNVDGAVDADGYPIDYFELGPFVFERGQYMEALSQLPTDG